MKKSKKQMTLFEKSNNKKVIVKSKKIPPPDPYLTEREYFEKPIFSYPSNVWKCDECGQAVFFDKATPFLHLSCSLRKFKNIIKSYHPC
jgi:hypothetical protein